MKWIPINTQTATRIPAATIRISHDPRLFACNVAQMTMTAAAIFQRLKALVMRTLISERKVSYSLKRMVILV